MPRMTADVVVVDGRTGSNGPLVAVGAALTTLVSRGGEDAGEGVSGGAGVVVVGAIVGGVLVVGDATVVGGTAMSVEFAATVVDEPPVVVATPVVLMSVCWADAVVVFGGGASVLALLAKVHGAADDELIAVTVVFGGIGMSVPVAFAPHVPCSVVLVNTGVVVFPMIVVSATRE